MSDRLENLYIHHSSALAMYVMSIVSTSYFTSVSMLQVSAALFAVLSEILTVAITGSVPTSSE